MDRSLYPYRNYLLVALLGALGGAIVVAILTRAIPKIGANMMSGMMEKFFQPGGLGHEMMARFGVQTNYER